MTSEPDTATARPDLVAIAAEVGRDWTNGAYYDEAEASIESQWTGLLWPLISQSDFSEVLEIAAGHGRNTVRLAPVSGHLTATDINETNIAFLKQRFANTPNVDVRLNNGADLRFIASGSISFAYCFDAMVHFDSDIVRGYVREIRRVLRPGGRGFCHVSAFDGNPTGTYRDHPGWRNFMSRALFEHWLAKEGLRPLKSLYIVGVSEIREGPEGADCICYFELPADVPTGGPFLDRDGGSEQTAGEASASREQIAQQRATIEELTTKLKTTEAELSAIRGSLTWRTMAPILRRVGPVISRLRGLR